MDDPKAAALSRKAYICMGKSVFLKLAEDLAGQGESLLSLMVTSLLTHAWEGAL